MALRSGVWSGLLALSVLGGCGDDRHLLGGAALEQNLGGSSASGGTGGGPQPVEPCGSCSQGAPCELIDDMEDGNPTIILERGRSGFWYSFNDQTAGAEQTPSVNTPFQMAVLEPPRVEHSERAASTHGSGFQDWGAGIAFHLLAQSPYDASQYAGIAFYGRSSASREMRFDVGDHWTVPQGGQCQGDDCYDHFGQPVQLRPEWQRFQYDWTELEQNGWGEPARSSIDPARLYEMRFQVSDPDAFEFWIDDVAFLCR